MENNSNSSIPINLREGSIIISGPECFVEKNMQATFEFVEKYFSSFPTIPLATPVSLPSSGTSANEHSTESGTVDSKTIPVAGNDKYISAGIYHIDSDDGTISILKKVPGNNKAEKAKNIALIVLYIRKGKIHGKEIIPICEKHNCYDSSKFSAIFKNEKTNIIRKGTGQSWTIELTQPGEAAAVALLEEMVNDTK